MKNYLLLLCLSLLFKYQTSAQSPQGINYQAVAYDNLSQPVTNHAVGVRLSVLDGGASGPVLYEETQTPNTDNTGLFSIVIGNGTVISGSFAGINWGNGTKWLKTEIDIAGGNNYVVMGSSQFMSAPYALYANSAGYAQKGGMATPTFYLPDGFDKITPVVIDSGSSYMVPTDKNLYLPNCVWGISINGDTLWPSFTANTADSRTIIGASAGSTVNCFGTKACFLIDKTVDWVTFNFKSTPYTVPAGKQLVIINQAFYYHDYNNPGNINCKVTLNGTALGISGVNFTNAVLEEGTVLSTVGCPASVGYSYNINGYLKDK